MKFYIVDAFTQHAFGGNGAGVVLLAENQPYPNEDFMVNLAAELRYSETALIRPLGSGSFDIRYFTPVAEVDLCGHATIGAFTALLQDRIISDNTDYSLKTMGDLLTITTRDGQVFMDMSAPKELGEITDEYELLALCDILGIAREDIFLTPQIISTGLPDIMLGVKSLEVLNSISPDFGKLAETSKNRNVVGLHAFALSDRENAVAHCRNFAPLYGIDEEAATGTSNGALTYYLYKQGIIANNQISTFLQGEAYGRLSEITTLVTEKDSSVSVRVGGNAVVLIKGDLII